MRNLTSILLQIQEWQLDQKSDPVTNLQLSSLRAKVPPSILADLDRMFARDRKAVAKAVNGACTACHLRLPTGTIASLRRGSEIQRCGCCGRYLYLVEDAPPTGSQPPLEKSQTRQGGLTPTWIKPALQRRSRRKPAPASSLAPKP